MVATISTMGFRGQEACPAEIRCQLTAGMARISVAGLPDAAAESLRERLKAALSAIGLSLPPKRIEITLSPVDAPNEDSHYDLPIALALLAAMGVIDPAQLSGWVVLGAVAPDGRILAAPGVARAAVFASESEKGLICPQAQEAEALEAGAGPVLAPASLIKLLARLKAERSAPEPEQPAAQEPFWKRVVGLGRKPTPPAAGNDPALVPIVPPPPVAPPTYPERQPPKQSSAVREMRQQFDSPPRESPATWQGAPPNPRPSRPFQRERREPSPDFHGIGHRERLRDRLLEGGADALADYEVLEFLLFGARRKGDTKPLAKALIKRFGSLPAVLNASPDALMQVQGIGRHSVGMIMIAAVSAKRMARAQIRDQPVLGTWNLLIDYLSIDMAHLTRERVRVLYLDSKNRLIKDEHISDGTIDEASVHPREVISHALTTGASALILVHNHPYYPHSITLDHARYP